MYHNQPNQRRPARRRVVVLDPDLENGSDSESGSESDEEEQVQAQAPRRRKKKVDWAQKNYELQQKRYDEERREKQQQSAQPQQARAVREFEQHIGFQMALEGYAVALFRILVGGLATVVAPIVKVLSYMYLFPFLGFLIPGTLYFVFGVTGPLMMYLLLPQIIGITIAAVSFVAGIIYVNFVAPEIGFTADDVGYKIFGTYVELADNISTFLTQVIVSVVSLGGTMPKAMGQHLEQHGYSPQVKEEVEQEGVSQGVQKGLLHWFEAYKAGVGAVSEQFQSHMVNEEHPGASVAQMGGAAASAAAAQAAAAQAAARPAGGGH